MAEAINCLYRLTLLGNVMSFPIGAPTTQLSIIRKQKKASIFSLSLSLKIKNDDFYHLDARKNIVEYSSDLILYAYLNIIACKVYKYVEVVFLLAFLKKCFYTLIFPISEDQIYNFFCTPCYII